MLNKAYITTLFLLFIIVFSCEQPAKKNNENEESSDIKPTVQELKQTEMNGTLSGLIGKYLANEYLTEGDLRIISADERKFQFSTIDLNGDGIDEIFVYLDSRYFCGSGGCIFLLMDKDLTLITMFTVTRAPILVSNKVENGWKKLYLISEGYREMVYNTQRKSYPTNPSMEKEIKENLINQKNITKLFESENKKDSFKF